MAAPTQDYEIVDGRRIGDIFQHLLQNHVMVKAFAGGQEIDRLLLIDEIEKKEGGSFSFKVRLNDELQAELIKGTPNRISLEFKGPDHLPYQCEARLSKLSEDHIWLNEPDHLRRYQLRNNFRVYAPRGVQLKTTINRTVVVMEIVNISLGGVYCHVNAKMTDVVKKRKSIRSVDLIFTYQDQCCEVRIQLAEMRRFEGRPRTGKVGVAYEFIRMEPEEKKKLIDQIYDMQREQLKSRLRQL
jgi:c-di-GMP-binding flagellar brake protein YcgR